VSHVAWDTTTKENRKMPLFRIKAEVVVTYTYDVEAETLAEAIGAVEDGEADDCMEIDSSGPTATEYALDGQMGWTDVTDDVRGAERFAYSPYNCPSNHWNRGDDVCEDCGTALNT
jgi:hypothetical protein